MYARLDSKDKPRDYYLLRNMAYPQDPPGSGGGVAAGAAAGGGGGGGGGDNDAMMEQNAKNTEADKDKMKKPGMGRHGRIFLGKDKDTFGEEGTGYIPYDPDFECGGPEGTDGRQCPHLLGEEESMGLELKGRKGRLLHIGIASYRDPLCPRTLYNTFTKASDPSSIRVRVLQQNDPELDPDCLEGYCRLVAKHRAEAEGKTYPEYKESDPVDASKVDMSPEGCPHSDQVIIHQVHAKEAAGPTWARGLLSADFAQAHTDGELSPQDHCMSIDSHMDYEPHWDEKMVEMWDMSNNEYAVLSTYVAGTEQLGQNLNGMHEVPHLCMVTFTSNVRTHATKMCQELSRPKLTNAIWGAGLSFSKCHAELKVPVDPHTPYIFDGEEFNRAARFFTHGYDVYTPHRVYVLHDYHGSQHNPTTASWHRNTDHNAMQLSQKRLKTMIDMPGGESDDAEAERIRRSKFGLGDRRSLDQLVEFSGVDTRNSKFPVDGKNRCGNVRWVSFAEHPKGVNYVPRYDGETEDPLDLPYDETSVWYDPKAVDGLGIGKEKPPEKKPAAAGSPEEDHAEDEENAAGIVVEGDSNALLPPGRDHEAHDLRENLVSHHEELRRAINEAEKEEAMDARPVISNAEAHAAGGIDKVEGYRARGAGGGGVLRGGTLLAGEAARRLGSVGGSTAHGFNHLPLPVRLAAVFLVLGLAVTVFVTAGTGRGAKLAMRYKRRRHKAV